MAKKRKWAGATDLEVTDDGLAMQRTSVGTDLLAGPDEIAVDDTANGKSLATLLGKAVDGELNTLTLLPAAAGIFWACGNATAAVNPLPAGGIELHLTKTKADALRFITASGTVKMSVLQEG